MTDISQFLDTGTQRLDATLVAAHVAVEPTALGRGVEGELYEYVDGVYVRDPNAVTRRVAAALGGRFSTTVLGQVNAHLLNIEMPTVGLPDLPRGYLDYIVLRNGIYWWQADQLDEHSPGLGALTQLPIEYDEQAIPHSFLDWLEQVLGDDPEDHRHLWEIIGYLLMTGNPLQKIILLYGSGGNGKGTLLRVLRNLLGHANYSSVSLHQLVEDRFASSNLYGKIANISGDLSAKFLTDSSILKEITGGDSISASRKHGHAFEFVPYVVPVFSSNEYFRVADTSPGWRRRWEVVEFTRTFEKAQPFDEQLLFDEASGIFNHAMIALRRLMTRGRFDPPTKARDATTRLHDEGDPFMRWLDEDDDVYLGAEESSATDDVYDRYKSWCRRNGYTPLASGHLGQRLKQQGITKHRPRDGLTRTQVYKGISVTLRVGD